MDDNLIDQIEEFLADGGEPDERVRAADGTPVFGSYSLEEMRAAYGDEWAEDFKRQFRGFTGLSLDA